VTSGNKRKQTMDEEVSVVLAVLCSEKKVKKERKPDNGHVPGLLEEDSMGCQFSKENLR